MTNALRGFASFLGLVFSLVAFGLLSSCGGGGASVNPDVGGPAQIFPEEGTFYAGVPSIIRVGGAAPYTLTSGDPTTLPVPTGPFSNTAVTVIPNNPGVVDTGLAPGALPIKTVPVTVRSINGSEATANIHVAQNFFVSYNAVVTSPTCPATTPPSQACAGEPGVVTMLAVVNGVLQAGKRFKFCNVIGSFLFFDIPTNSLQQCIIVTADAQGKVVAPFQVLAGAQTQIAIFRVSDADNPNVFQDTLFTITGAGAATPATLTAIPSTISFTGRNANECGTGSADVFIFDGKTPYQGISTDPNITVTGSDPLPPQNGGTAPPATSSTQPGRFTVTVNNPNACIDNKPVIFTDATGGRVVVTVSTVRGTSPPAAPITVAPPAITLNSCGASGSVSVAGGSGNYQVSSSTSRIQAFVVGNTITITRIQNGDTAPITTPQAVGVTDGATTQTVNVVLGAAAQFCP